MLCSQTCGRRTVSKTHRGMFVRRNDLLHALRSSGNPPKMNPSTAPSEALTRNTARVRKAA